MSRFGIDYAWHKPITDAVCKELRKAGVTFVIRYFSNNSDSKNLSLGEAKMLSKHGIDVVVAWESLANAAERGRAGGVADAKRAVELQHACQMPADRPIYFAIDEDVVVGSKIEDYFRGVASVIGLKRTGVYCGVNQMRTLFSAGVVKWGFQTYAWSGGKWHPRAQVRQYSNSHTVAGLGCDYDTAVASDFGQWRIGDKPHHAPKPKPVPLHLPPRDMLGNWPYGPSVVLANVKFSTKTHRTGVQEVDHKHVEAWQEQMRERGHHVVVDGLFGEATEAVTKAFQKEAHLPVTGMVNHETWHHGRWDPA